MKSLTLNAGHSAAAPGASGSGYQEHKVARLVNTEMIRQARERGLIVSDSTSDAQTAAAVVNEAVKLANKSGAQLAISNHFNAGGGTGTETYYDDMAAESTALLAARVSDAIAKHYGLKDRGAKKDTQSAPGSLAFTSNTEMEALLIEWCFIDNAADMAKIMVDISGGVSAVLDAIHGNAPYVPQPTDDCFPAAGVSSGSLVDALKKIGVDSSKTYRVQIATANGISDYSGTVEQNRKMAAMLADGKLVRPGSIAPVTSDTSCYPAVETDGSSFIDALRSININSSKSHRARIATANGVYDYSGTANQNTYLLKLLRAGKLKTVHWHS